MKKLFYSIALLSMLCACGNTDSITPASSVPPASSSSASADNSSSPSVSSGSVEESSAPVSSSSPSIDSSISATPKTPLEIALEKLQSGYSLRSKYSRDELDAEPTSFKYYETILGNKSAAVNEYKNETFTEVKTATLYQKSPDNLFCDTYYSLNGKVTYTPVEILDPLLGDDVTWEWEDLYFDNAFTNFTLNDFTKNEDGSYSLVITDDKLLDAAFLKGILNIGTQISPFIDGGVDHYFIQQKLLTFNFTLDAEGIPTSFEATYETEKSSWSDTIYQRKAAGTFTAFGNNLIEPLQDKESSLPELDVIIESLKNNNYEAHIQKDNAGDVWSDPYTVCKADLISDGDSFEYVATLNSGWGADTYKNQGYINTDATHYRKYTFDSENNYTYISDAADSIEGQVSSLFPSFDITGAFMQKDEEASTDTKNVYRWNRAPFMKNIDITLFTSFDGLINGIAQDEFTIIVENGTITFKAVAGLYTCIATYSNIGNITSLNRIIEEPVKA